MKKGVIIVILFFLSISFVSAAPFFEGSVWDKWITGNTIYEDFTGYSFFSFFSGAVTKTPKPTCLETVQLSRWNDETAMFGDQRFLDACTKITGQTGTLPCACTGTLTCQAERCGKTIGVIKPNPYTQEQKPKRNEFRVLVGNSYEYVELRKQKQIEGFYVQVNKFDAKKEIIELTISDVRIKPNLKVAPKVTPTAVTTTTQKTPTSVSQPTKVPVTIPKKPTLPTLKATVKTQNFSTNTAPINLSSNVTTQ